jgi:hypothetical protein
MSSSGSYNRRDVLSWSASAGEPFAYKTGRLPRHMSACELNDNRTYTCNDAQDGSEASVGPFLEAATGTRMHWS